MKPLFPFVLVWKKKERDLLQCSNLKKKSTALDQNENIQFYRNLGNNECRLFGCHKKMKRDIDDSS